MNKITPLRLPPETRLQLERLKALRHTSMTQVTITAILWEYETTHSCLHKLQHQLADPDPCPWCGYQVA